MNKIATGAWIAALTAVVTLFATNGKALVEAAMAAWLFLLNLAESAPLGLSSFLLALALAVASRPFLAKYMPAFRCHNSREFLIDMAGLATGFCVMFGQLRTFNGALLGLLAGFSAPLIARGIGAGWNLATRGRSA